MSMKLRILVLYYTQSGQLREMIDHLLAEVEGKAEIDFVPIEPVTPFPFPWTSTDFYDVMPETVLNMPRAVKPLPQEVFDTYYNLVILGYQPWFLHPSQPVAAFLQGNDARVLNKKPVVTVVGASNMWLNAQEQVKGFLKESGARLVGNIVLADNRPDPVALVTLVRWVIKGQKDDAVLLPTVQNEHSVQALRLGGYIHRHLADDNLIDLHRALLSAGGVKFSVWMMLQEQMRLKWLTSWARFIHEKGKPGTPGRVKSIAFFRRFLFAIVLIGMPFSSLITLFKLLVKGNRLEKDKEYFRQLAYEKNRL